MNLFTKSKRLLSCVLAAVGLVGSSLAQVENGYGFDPNQIKGSNSTINTKVMGKNTGTFRPKNPKITPIYPDPGPLDTSRGLFVDQQMFEPNTPPTSFRNFDGITATGWTPPDPEVAAGPNNLVVVTNSHFAIHSKDGAQGYITSFGNFMGGGYFYFDPKVTYDVFNNRFLILLLANKYDGSNNVTESHYVLLYSDDSDAYGNWGWKFYNAKYDGGTFNNQQWADFPHLGVANGGICMSSIKFGTFGGGSVYSHVRFVRSAEVYGAGGGWWDFWNLQSSGQPDYRPVPARQQTDPGAFYMVSAKEWGASNVCIRRFTNYTFSGGGPVMTETVKAVGAYLPNGLAFQQSNANKLEVNDGRILSVSYANGRLFAVNGNRNDWGDGSGQRSTVKAMCFDIYNSYNTLIDQSFGASGSDYYYPAISTNWNGDAVISFGRSGQSENASCRVAGYKVGETGFGFSTNVMSGAAGYYVPVDGRNRWGDYFGASMDPFDNQTIWTIGQYTSSANTWRTRVQENNYKPFFQLANANVSGPITSTVTLSTTLTSSAGGTLSGYTVNFTVGGVGVGSAVTNGSGVATLNYAIPYGLPTSYTIGTSIPNSYSYNGTTGSSTLTTTKANTTSFLYNEYPTAGTNVTLYGYLWRNTDNAYIGGRNLYFYVNGFYAGVDDTDANGLATISYAVNSGWQGQYPTEVDFFGDSYYFSSYDTASLFAYQPTTAYVWNAEARRTEGAYLYTQYFNSAGSPIVGGDVYFYMDGVYLGTTTTDSSGYGYWYYVVPAGATLGNHTWSAYLYPPAASPYQESKYVEANLLVKGPSFIGNGTLQDFTYNLSGYNNIRVKVKNSGGTVVADTVVSGYYGSWEVPYAGPSGNYKVIIKPDHWLSDVEFVVPFNSATYGSNWVYTSHKNGDSVNDDIIDLSDYTAVATAFNGIYPNAPYTYQADLNGDGVVDLTDYTIIAVNFNSIGEGYGE